MRRGTAVPLKPLKHRYTLKERLKRLKRQARRKAREVVAKITGSGYWTPTQCAEHGIKLKPSRYTVHMDPAGDPAKDAVIRLHEETPNAPEANAPASNDQAEAGAEGTAPTSEPAREADRDGI